MNANPQAVVALIEEEQTIIDEVPLEKKTEVVAAGQGLTDYDSVIKSTKLTPIKPLHLLADENNSPFIYNG